MTDSGVEGRTTVGVIGLGRVGWPVAQSVMATGAHVVGYQRRGSRDLQRAGGTVASSAQEVMEQCDLVFLALPSAHALDSVVVGANGLCDAGRRQSAVVVDLSTTGYAEKNRAREALAAIGVEMLDCPVGGVPNPSSSSPILDSMFASGDKAAYERSAHVLGAVAANLWYVGDFGKGITLKLIINTLVALHTIATAEALALGTQAGLDNDIMLEVLAGSPGTSWVLKDRARRMIEGPYTPARGSIDMMRKDLLLVEELARSAGGSSTPMMRLAGSLYDTAADRGWGDQDVSVMYRLAKEP